jgi:hypothetical protein
LSAAGGFCRAGSWPAFRGKPSIAERFHGNPTRFVVNIDEIVLNIHENLVNIHENLVNIHENLANIHENLANIHEILVNIHEILVNIREILANVGGTILNIIRVLKETANATCRMQNERSNSAFCILHSAPYRSIGTGRGLPLLWASFCALEWYADLTELLATRSVTAASHVLSLPATIGWRVLPASHLS